MNPNLALVVIALVTATNLIVLLLLERMMIRERRALVDRIVARHAGEVLALDAHGQPKEPPKQRPVLEGVS